MNRDSIAANTFIQASVVALVVLAVMLLLRADEAFLAIFGGVLFAILFNSAARWIQDKTGLPYGGALALAIIGPMAILGGGLWFAAPAVSEQAAQLVERVPEAFRQLQEQLREWKWTDQLLDQQDRVEKLLPEGSAAAGALGSFFSSSFGALGNLVIALAVGLFLAINPHLYIKGLVHLFPLDKRERAQEVFDEVASSLRSWLAAKLVAMFAIGTLTTVGLWLIGIDLALVLGLVAAMLSFIPNIGPIIALLPAALIGLVDGPEKLLYVVILYIGVQSVESYLLTPLLQQRMVDLPPALTLGVQVFLGVVAGAMGLILAAPLAAAGMVIVQMWYVQDVLGDRSSKG
ncbi:AI-2E family transporter [Hydrogenophaga sp.]|uniref:AI-2E family transporter n=1 Tax=Hydrogenophaga sp. TaxID=1904254 RepID=UPI0027219B90|nr:AI-2E family transporter [Hydrogenophaga sp.]MDO9133617.1 AI-2E family transporter [Hydrogenophaga sp.]